LKQENQGEERSREKKKHVKGNSIQEISDKEGKNMSEFES